MNSPINQTGMKTNMVNRPVAFWASAIEGVRVANSSARAEKRWDTQLDELGRETKWLKEQVDGYLAQISALEVRVIQLEKK